MGILAAYAVPHPPLIIPSVGRGEERGVQSTIDAYREVARRVREHAPQTVVVSSPHAPLFRDAFFVDEQHTLAGDMARFRAPETALSVGFDTPLAREIRELAEEAGVPCAGASALRFGAGDEMDHATFIPLWFIGEEYRECGEELDFEVVRLGLSGLSAAKHRKFGQAIAAAADKLERRAVYIASGDLSHKLKADGPYGFADEGPVLDAAICEIFESGNLSQLLDLDEDFCEKAAECGVRSFQIMAGALEGCKHTSELLAYEGPFGVGYATAAFEVEDEGEGEAEGAGAAETATEVAAETAGEAEAAGEIEAANPDPAPDPAPDPDPASDPYVALARASVEGYVRTGKPIKRPENLPAEMLETRAGAFVSLHEHGQLRGCIGTIAPTCACVADEIIENGISAATRDPRFNPVSADELDFLEISVDVLGAPEPVSDLSELVCKRFGVIVTKGQRRGLLLPDLEGVDSVDEQLAIAKRKAGISPADDNVYLERFEVVRHTAGGKARRD